MIKDIITKNESVALNEKQMQVLKEYFPACFHDGEFDMTRFKEYLGNNLAVNHEGYELRFLGKNYARFLASLILLPLSFPTKNTMLNLKMQTVKTCILAVIILTG